MPSRFVDIENELIDIDKEAVMLAEALQVYEAGSKDRAAWKWLAVHCLASGIEKIYTGCERVMMMIAASIDGMAVDHIDGWHISLLKRLSHPFTGVRDAVISQECFGELDRLRAFRHRERNSYGLTLDAEIVLQRARETQPILRRFSGEVLAFLAER